METIDQYSFEEAEEIFFAIRDLLVMDEILSVDSNSRSIHGFMGGLIHAHPKFLEIHGGKICKTIRCVKGNAESKFEVILD